MFSCKIKSLLLLLHCVGPDVVALVLYAQIT